MGYRFEADEDVEAGLARIATEQVAKAREDLAREGSAEAVHELRKRTKKLRGLVRLVRPAFERYAEENALFRATAERLAPQRDATASLVTLSRLRHEHAGDADPDTFAAAETALLERKARLEREQDLDARIALVRSDLDVADEHIDRWTLDGEGLAAIASGLRKTYARARRAMRRAYAEPTAENFHEWRKRVKYHLYHVRLVQPAWAPVLAAREEELDALGDLLGDAHDLVVLEQLLSSDEIDLEPRARELLAGVCQSQRRRLEQRARPSGERLFAESPKAIGRRMRSYVRTWREAA